MTANNSPKKLFEFQYELLTKEIEYIHSRISHFDDLAFQIKGWTITIWSAIIAFGSTQDSFIVLASLPATITFWVLDALFKQYQRRLINRMAAIEMFLDSRGPFAEEGLRSAFEKQDFGRFPIHDPISSRTKRINDSFRQRYREGTVFWRAFLAPNITYFYSLLIISAVIIAILLNK